MGLFFTLSFSFRLVLSLSISDALNVVDDIKTFIVRVQHNLLSSEFSDVEEWYNSILHSLISSDDDPLESSPQKTNNSSSTQTGRHNNLIHVYKSVFHGFSATLTKQHARILQTYPEILQLFSDRLRQIQTTRTPQFLGLTPAISNKLLSILDYGSNIVLGLLDSGVWPESPSFHGDGLGPIPSHWKGQCTEGDRFFKINCNRKLIGARFFTSGYDVGRVCVRISIEANCGHLFFISGWTPSLLGTCVCARIVRYTCDHSL